MTVLLERGAIAVRPVAELEEAYALRSRDDDLLLGGERHNRPPEGFDGGNSPYDWPSERVYGRRVASTTTNGTAAIERVKAVPRLILAALINADAAGRYLLELERPALLVASGADHRASLEDVLAAGAVARVWPRQRRTDAAEMAVMVFESCAGRLGEAVRAADHGQDLIKLGLDDDLAFAAELNSSRVVPVLCRDGWLRAAD
jgi:2-phosphosulfolactate phosphatase